MANYHPHPFPNGHNSLSPNGSVLLRSLPLCKWFGRVYLYCMILDVSSCAGRCGEGYSRDTPCNCDYNCQLYMECCPDFKKFCTVGKCQELASPLSSITVLESPLLCSVHTIAHLVAQVSFPSLA